MRNGHRIHVRRLLNDATELAGNSVHRSKHRTQASSETGVEKEVTKSAVLSDEIGIFLAILEDITRVRRDRT